MNHTDAEPGLPALLALEGAEFLGRAYLALLGRPIDSEGMRHYAAKLRAGQPKLLILDDLHSSPEAQASGQQVRGLVEALRSLYTRELAAGIDIDGLLALDGEIFLEQLHYALGLSPDDRARRYFLARLRSGRHKLEVIDELLQIGPANPAAPLVQALRRLVAAAATPLFPQAATLDELLTLEDIDFVQCAFRTLLQRSARPQELDHHARQLRAGASKLGVLSALSACGQGDSTARTLPGLKAKLARYRHDRRPHLRRSLHAWPGESDASQVRHMRALAAALACSARTEAQAIVRAHLAAEEVDQLLRPSPSEAAREPTLEPHPDP